MELPVSVAAKVLLLNEMLRQKVRPIDLARRIGTTKQEVNRLTDLKHATKIDRIDAALRALESASSSTPPDFCAWLYFISMKTFAPRTPSQRREF